MATAAFDVLDGAAREFERAMQRNLKGLEYFQTSGPILGATPKDVLIERGTMRLYHYHPRTDDVYRVPLLLVMTHLGLEHLRDFTGIVPVYVARRAHVLLKAAIRPRIVHARPLPGT